MNMELDECDDSDGVQYRKNHDTREYFGILFENQCFVQSDLVYFSKIFQYEEQAVSKQILIPLPIIIYFSFICVIT